MQLTENALTKVAEREGRQTLFSSPKISRGLKFGFLFRLPFYPCTMSTFLYTNCTSQGSLVQMEHEVLPFVPLSPSEMGTELRATQMRVKLMQQVMRVTF